MNLQQQIDLKAELLLPAYKAMTTQEKADALNALTVPRFQPVSYRDVASYFMVVDKYLVLNDATDDAAREFMLAMRTFNNFDMTNPIVETKINASLDALVTAGHLTAADKAAVLSLADAPISRAEELGLGFIQDYDVDNAEAYNG